MKFIDKLKNGLCAVEDIDDFIDEWHDGDYTKELYDFLGLSKNEYVIWVNTGKIVLDESR